ncbi:MAG: hypothetical protein A2Y10_12450 [Planctomycetes bacterium GWF2_41_51]|nr:MAG: hypothetical protein A2Y10_12450 [Planctomycetes bacterium GWF2_41_51]HBG27232.1 hypothetical protein [Phycisphaerales bacterium]
MDMKVHVDGSDMLGWSIDQDRANLITLLSRMGLKDRSWFSADIIHNLWWKNILNYNYIKFFLRKKILLTASNFIDIGDEEYFLYDEFKRAEKIATAWIAPSMKQKSIFDSHGIRSYYFPFLIDQDIFRPLAIDKKKLFEQYKIPTELQNKVVIGSFQRDSLGKELSKPKWQKGPELLIELVKDLPAENYVLLLAGPRRHYLLEQCKKHGISYYYLGAETCNDDIKTNHIPIDQMPMLYHLTDVYLISSRSEGGPKAVLEACSTRTFVMSTDVGLAGDFMDADYVFDGIGKYKKRLSEIVEDFDKAQIGIANAIDNNYSRFNTIMRTDALCERLCAIYSDVMAN